MTTSNYQQHGQGRTINCRDNKNNRIAFGGLIILIGLIILTKRLGLFYFPFHVWPLVLIAIGIYSGVKHQFRNFGSWALIILGVFFMIPKFFFFGILSTHLVAPVMLILLGLFLILRPSRRHWRGYNSIVMSTTDEDTVNVNVMFGEKNSVITSKTFKGGVISSTFGSVKVNLLQTDSPEPMVLDMNVSFGSVDVLVPSNWRVELQVDNSFASVEDQRFMQMHQPEDSKVLILKGSCSFGSINVKSL
jgi:predicted membrane protein